jgi:hypothetical protein
MAAGGRPRPVPTHRLVTVAGPIRIAAMPSTVDPSAGAPRCRRSPLAAVVAAATAITPTVAVIVATYHALPERAPVSSR